jgi:hypothetical protein
MKPPKPFKIDIKRGYSQCYGCEKWTFSNSIFHHDGMHLILCRTDYEDYWENMDTLLDDYKGYT